MVSILITIQHNMGSVSFEKDLKLQLYHNSTQQGSNLGYGINVFLHNTLTVQGKTTIDIGSQDK